MNIELNGEQIFYNIAFLVAISVSIFALSKLTSAKTWPTTSGQVISVKAKVLYNRDSGVSGTIDYPVDIQYSYRIQGNDFTGNSINAGLPNVFSDEKDQAQFISEYPAGEKIDVYYNPDKFSESALKIWKLTTIQVFFIWGFLGFVGTVIFVFLNLFLHPSNPIDKFMSKITGS